ncbi:ABC transporter permease [Treponema sp. TIM-1]|uniref:ABC transporter permease n=1 Tax=Treponema sp. TIM-1 TaxID=2898417 RepID=UPI003980D380
MNSKLGGIAGIFRRVRQVRETGLLFVLILLGIVLSFLTPVFFTGENFLNIFKQVTLVTIVACGQTFVLTSGGIDLSVGGILGLSSIIMAWTINHGMNTPGAIAVCLLFGTMVGITNGFLITKLRLPPFIITLGMASIAKGFVLVITKGYAIMLDNPFIIAIGQNSWGVFPVMVIFLPIVVIIAHWVYNYTIFGNRVKSIGGNETAARLSGINVKNNKIFTYALCGFLCGLAGLIITGRLNSGNPNAGTNFDMNSIGAVIVGGTSLSGGSGTIIGTMLGALLMGVISNGLVLLGVNMYWQTVATGAIIIVVCALDSFSQRKGDAYA